MSAPAIRIPWELSIERRWAAESLAAAAGARVTADTGPELALERDDLDLAFRHLARVEEGAGAKTDEHGRFPASSSCLRRREAPVDALLPTVTARAAQDRRRARAALARRCALLRRADARHRHALALDASGHAWRRRAGSSTRCGDLRLRDALLDARGLARMPLHKMRRSDPNWCFEHVAELESRRGFSSTSYVMAAHRDPHDGAVPEAYAARRPRLVQELALLGGEVGLHGSYRSCDDEALLRAEKHDLELLLGQPGARVSASTTCGCAGTRWSDASTGSASTTTRRSASPTARGLARASRSRSGRGITRRGGPRASSSCRCC